MYNLERAFNRAFHFEEAPRSLTPAPAKEQSRWVDLSWTVRLEHSYNSRLSGTQQDTNTLGKKSLMDDFWLPKVSGALGAGKRGGKNPSQFQHVVSSQCGST